MKKLIIGLAAGIAVVILLILAAIQIFSQKLSGWENEHLREDIDYDASYLSCGCGCCSSDRPLEEVARVECLYKEKGESLQDKIDQDRSLTPEACAAVGCSLPVKYVYCT